MKTLLSCLSVAAFALIFACAPSVTPREVARAAVLTIADGVRQADISCAATAAVTHDAKIASDCAAAYVEARGALLIAEDGVNAWDAAAAKSLPCAAKAALAGLDKMVTRFAAAGGNVPSVVADARKLATALTEACHG